MVSLIQISQLGRNGTFGTPLKGDVPSCPAFGPSYGRTFCDNVTPCPVLSRRQVQQLKFWIKSEITFSRPCSVDEKIITTLCCTFRARQIAFNQSAAGLSKGWPTSLISYQCSSVGASISNQPSGTLIRCVDDFQKMRVAVSHQINRMEAVLMSQMQVTTENRLNALGYKLASKRKPLEALDARGKLLIEYQIYGCPHAWIRQYTRAAPVGEDPGRRIPIEPGWPLTLEEAADALRIKRRNARWISRQSVFQRELAEQLQCLRSGMKARAVLAQCEILDDRGDGAAADRKVRLQAAQAILGEDIRDRSVNVTVNNGVQLTAGIVVRLPASASVTPLENLGEECENRNLD